MRLLVLILSSMVACSEPPAPAPADTRDAVDKARAYLHNSDDAPSRAEVEDLFEELSRDTARGQKVLRQLLEKDLSAAAAQGSPLEAVKKTAARAEALGMRPPLSASVDVLAKCDQLFAADAKPQIP